MKKFLVPVLAMMIGALMFAGCAGTGMNVSPDFKYAAEFKDAPQWVKDGGSSIEGGQAAVGSAQIGKAGVGFARTEAQAKARDELARQMQVKVKNLFKRFTEQIGLGSGQTVDKTATDISKQVAKQTLSGSRLRDSWISPSDTLYVLMVIDDDLAKANVREAVETSFKNDQALWQKFQAKKGFEELEKELEKEFGKN